MAQSNANSTDDSSSTPGLLRQSARGGLGGLITLLKYLLYGSAAYFILSIWITLALIPAILVGGATNFLVGVVVWFLTFAGIGCAYGAVKDKGL